MKKWLGIAGLLLLLGAVLIVAVTESTALSAKAVEGTEEGNKALDFTLTGIDGKESTLSDYEGKRVMLNFWATWCPPCKAEMPAMQQLHENKYGNVEIVSVNIDPQNDVEGFIDEYGLTFPVLIDEDAEVNKKYSILSIPTTYLINEKGIISKKHIGSMNLEQMKEFLD